EGEASLRIAGQSDMFADAVLRSFKVVPEGFPVASAKSDMLRKVANLEVPLPNEWFKGTLKCQVQLYPSPLGALQGGLDSMLREPHGCFEQTSSSNYPNLLILNYLQESNQANPEVTRRALTLLERGYRRLTTFECTNPRT